MKELIEKNGMDKVAHFFGIGVISLIVSLIFAKFDTGYPAIIYAVEGLIAGGLVAVAKEAWDFCNGGEFDTKDIIAGLIGSAIAFIAILLLL
jgi:hypothetical protein